MSKKDKYLDKLVTRTITAMGLMLVNDDLCARLDIAINALERIGDDGGDNSNIAESALKKINEYEPSTSPR
jgi:hypothetical protein